jgi:eukaryotic-like serine/threonine-protein kinase
VTEMSPAETVFFAALAKVDPAERAAYLNEACGADADLRRQVDRLLAAHPQVGSFLQDDAGVHPSPLAGVEPEARSGATVDVPIAERPGTVIGPYKLLQQIGEGGMGTVFMAEQMHPVQRKVALKVIKPGMDSRQVIARFEAERQALAMMDHVNIARVFDGGSTEAGLPYFVMELVHGVPITQYCDDNKLTLRERLELFVPVCQAIQHAHQKGIIHRDIKPSNVMITLYDGQPVPKVIDFGVAKATEQKLTERTLFTQYGTMVGTLEYMSPEQAEMSALGVDTRCDIYSLGVLLYELLTGSTPLTHKRLKEAAYGEMLRMLKEEEPPKPSTRLSDSGEALASISANRHMEPAKLTKLMRGELDWIVMKALEKDRNRRYDTANGFAADVQRYLNDEPVQACPATALYRFRKFARRNKVALTTVTVISAALVLGTLLSTWQAIRASRAGTAEREQRQGAEDARQQAVGDRDRALQAEEQARRRLYEARLAQAQAMRWSGRVGRRFESLKALKEAAHIARTLPETDQRLSALRDEAIACLALADVQLVREWEGKEPGSRQEVWFDADLAHYARMDAKTGDVSICAAADGRELARLASTDKFGFNLDGKLTFSPDADHIAIRDSRGHLQVWDWRHNVRLFETDFPISAMSFSPDGRQVAVGQAEGAIVTYELATGKEVRRLRGPAEPESLAFHPDGTKLAVASRRSKEVPVYEVATGQVVQKLSGHPREVWSVAWHPRGYLLATASEANAYLWDPATGRQHAVLQGHQATVVGVTFLPPGDLVLSTKWEGPTRLWEAATGRFLVTIPGNGFRAFNRAGSRLAGYTEGTKIGLWEVAPGREYRMLSSPAVGQRAFVQDGSISPDGRWLAVGEKTGARLWDLELGQDRAFLPIGATQGVAFHPKDEALFTCGHAGLYRWPVHQEAETLRVGPPRQLPMPGILKRVRLDAAGRVLVVASYAGGHVVNLEGSPGQVPLLDHKAANQVTVSPDGRWVATGTHRGFGIKVWDARSGKLIRALLPDARTSLVLFSPDGRWLATAAGNETCLWEVGSWQLARRFPSAGHLMAFTRDGQTLALSTARDVVQLVDPATGRRFAKLQAPDTSSLTSLIAFSADGSQLFVGTPRSPLVRVWDLRLIRAQLKDMGLDWDLPPYPPPSSTQATTPLRVQVGLSELGYTVYSQQAEAQAALLEWDKAVVSYSKAIEAKPNEAAAWGNRGLAHERLGQWDKAIADYTKALDLKPDVPVLCNNLARLLATCPDPSVRDPGRAVELAKRAVELAPKQGKYWHTLGMAHYRAGDSKAALAALEKATTLRNGGNSYDWFFLAMAHGKLGEKEEARQWYHRAVWWMEKQRLANNEELRRFRAEAAALLKIADDPTTKPKSK